MVKPYVVLVHGLRGDHHGLLQIAEALQGDFDVMTPDLPGSGKNPELDDKTLAGYAEWLHAYCAELPGKPYIVGHSMGSIIVSHFVNKYPGDVLGRVVLMAPIFRTKLGGGSSKILHWTMRAALSPLLPKMKHRVMASRQVSYVISHFLTHDKSKQKEIDELHYKYSGRFASAKSLIADAEISMTQTAIVPEGKEVLLCVGTGDRLVDAEFVQVIAKKEGAKVQVVENAGHLLNYEKPREVAGIIKNFLLGA